MGREILSDSNGVEYLVRSLQREFKARTSKQASAEVQSASRDVLHQAVGAAMIERDIRIAGSDEGSDSQFKNN